MRTFLVGILPLSVKTFFLGAPTFPRALTASLTRRPANEIKEGFRELAERPAYSLPQRVLEVFQLVDADGSGQLDEAELGVLLEKLHLDATEAEVAALHAHLDHDASGEVDFGEFYDWYQDAAEAADQRRLEIVNTLRGRSCAMAFEDTPVPNSVVDSAIESALCAVDHRASEPWRFKVLGPETIAAACAAAPVGSELATDGAPAPGCLVVTQQLQEPLSLSLTLSGPLGEGKEEKMGVEGESNDEEGAPTVAGVDGGLVGGRDKSDVGRDRRRDDYASCCCAVQNFLLAMHAEGLGTRWFNPGSGPFNFDRDPEALRLFAETVGVGDLSTERVVAVVWYGFASGGLESLPAPIRTQALNDVRVRLP